jgi:glycosyltransferase involved in cell wall biosynthesis
MDEKKCFPELISRVKVRVVPYPVRCPLFYYNMFLGMRRIGREISKMKFDVVNIHNFPSEWAAYFIKTRVVWMCNEPPFWYFLPEDMKKLRWYNKPLNLFFDRRSVRSVDKVLVLSRMMGEVVKKAYGKDYEVIRTGVDVRDEDKSAGAEFRKKYGLEGAFIALQVGYISHYKRNVDSVRALGFLKEHENLRLVFVGDGEPGCTASLKEAVRKEGLADRVLFLGPLGDDELDRAYAACDVFLFPAFQSWSLVATEAMAHRKPVIVSDRCGVSEIIEQGETGFVIGHGDYRELAGHMERLLEDEGLRQRIGNNAVRSLKENLSWPRYAAGMEKAFEEARGLTGP